GYAAVMAGQLEVSLGYEQSIRVWHEVEAFTMLGCLGGGSGGDRRRFSAQGKRAGTRRWPPPQTGAHDMTHHIRRSIILGLAALPLAGCGANSPPAATPPFVYVANSKHDEISQYSASSSDSGALTPLTRATVPTGRFPYGITV